METLTTKVAPVAGAVKASAAMVPGEAAAWCGYDYVYYVCNAFCSWHLGCSPQAARTMLKCRSRQGGQVMKRFLIVMVIGGVLALPTPALQLVDAAAPPASPAPTPEASSQSSPCALPNGALLAAMPGCCQRQGGVCGCRNGTAQCCNGARDACPCRADTPVGQFSSAF
jgi:hypothetical protein